MSMTDFADDFRAYLQSGERIVWTGRPAQGVRLSGRDAFLIPFSLLWGGFAIFWETSVLVMAIRTVAVLPMVLFGGAFVVVGCYMMFGRFFVDAWARSRTVYALTDRRALIARRLFGEKLIAVSLLNCPQLRLSLRGARGDIDFEAQQSMFGGRSWGLWTPALDGAARFIGIEDAADVFRLAQRPGSPA